MNPAFRSSSPQPANYDSHHDPYGEPAADMGQGPQSSSREPTVTPQKPPQQGQAMDPRRGNQLPPNYDPNQHGEIGSVPHNSYPTDGMTMFCRAGPPSEHSSATSAYRPSSREDSQSELSNPTSMSSQEPPTNVKQTPTKPASGGALPPAGGEKQVQKKRSAFFSNSPFRRKSRYDKDRQSGPSQPPSRGGWDSPAKQPNPPKQPQQHMGDGDRISGSPEPADPRANFQLNVGNNVFDVASPDKNPQKNAPQANANEGDMDPIARALADLKGAGKHSASRVSADRYHGISTPVPSAPGSQYTTNAVATPPPAYDPAVKRLDAPQPAFTSAQMQKTTQRYAGQTQNMFRGSGGSSGMGSRNGEQYQDMPRAKSPSPRGSASPQASPARMGQHSRGGSASPTPYQTNPMRNHYSQSPPSRGGEMPFSPNDYNTRGAQGAPGMPRAVSPQPQFRQQARPSSAGGMEMQLSGNPPDMYPGAHDPRTRGGNRPIYNEGGVPGGRTRSRTLAEPGRQYSRDGRPILHFGKQPKPTLTTHVTHAPSSQLANMMQLVQCTATPPRSPRNSASPRVTCSP